MSPDWAAKAEPVPYAKLDNPQSLNLYEYVGNNPLSRADPDGHSWDGFKQALQKAFAEVSAKASFGFGIGGKENSTVKGKTQKVTAEAAVKYNLTAKAGKLTESLSAEVGVKAKIGDKKTVGLDVGVEKKMGTIDTNTGTASGPEKTTYDYTVGTKSGGTTVQGNNESFSFGTEAGEGLIGGGQISITREGVADLKEAVTELKDALTPK